MVSDEGMYKGVPWVKGPFIASLIEWLQAFCGIALNMGGRKKSQMFVWTAASPAPFNWGN